MCCRLLWRSVQRYLWFRGLIGLGKGSRFMRKQRDGWGVYGDLFKTYLNLPHRLEPGLTSFSALVIAEGFSCYREGGNPFGIYEWFKAGLQTHRVTCFQENISILAFFFFPKLNFKWGQLISQCADSCHVLSLLKRNWLRLLCHKHSWSERWF